MADWVTDFYNQVGAMPRQQDGKLVQSRSNKGMTQEEADAFYQAVGLPESRGPTTRSVRTIAIDPQTGNPIPNAPSQQELGQELMARGSSQFPARPGVVPSNSRRPTAPVYQPRGSIVSNKSQDRLTPNAHASAYSGGPGSTNEAVLAAASFNERSVPHPRPRPNVPAPVGANPGSTGLFGHTMSPNIPAQMPPPGVAPTVWAAQDRAPAQTAPRAAASNPVVQQGIQAAQQLVNRTGTTAAGYTYENGQRTGKASWALGLTPSQQYDRAAARARASSPDNGGNPSWW